MLTDSEIDQRFVGLPPVVSLEAFRFASKRR
ncbi:uncharacterized protein METZ01_LOCUS506736, partial [marine metagenome]